MKLRNCDQSLPCVHATLRESRAYSLRYVDAFPKPTLRRYMQSTGQHVASLIIPYRKLYVYTPFSAIRQSLMEEWQLAFITSTVFQVSFGLPFFVLLVRNPTQIKENRTHHDAAHKCSN